MKKSINWPYAILIGIILVMGYFLIFNQPDPVVEPFDEGPLREEIRIQDSIGTHWQKQSAEWETKATQLGHKSDSLETLKPTIKNYYNEKYIFLKCLMFRCYDEKMCNLGGT